MSELEANLASLAARFRDAVANASDERALDEARVAFLGRSGAVTEVRKGIGKLPPPERPGAGKVINEAVAALEAELVAARTRVEARALARSLEDRIDVTLPAPPPHLGAIHPVRRVALEVARYFTRHGFAVVLGPEIETDANNFDALNIPPDHPAREGLDSFYLRPDLVLRTHTSPMQVRSMRKHGPPIAIIVPGKAFRRDANDARHLYMFHQVEGLMVGRGIHFGHLKGMLVGMCRELFGPDADVRFRPSFFPFTEPSAEIDVNCPACKGAGGELRHVRRQRLDRDRRQRHGASQRAARRRLRSRRRDGLGLRLRSRAHRDETARHQRHPRDRREPPGLRGVARLMRVPLAWLRDYADLPDEPQTIVARLAALGFPVDEVIERPRLTNVVVGTIVALERHPNADRLQLCTLDVGDASTLLIATAATNVAQGQTVPVARIGAQLAGGLTIAPRKMRGVDSQGMLISAEEVGLPGDWFEDGIMQLEPSIANGTDFVAHFRLEQPVLDVDVTPNRPDALSILGLARELAASFGVPLREPETAVACDGESGDARVTIETVDCKRFVFQRASGVRVRPANAAMRIRLALAGQRPLNNLVDISNFVMLEVGQPMHFFDWSHVEGKHLIVRDAQDGERFTTLDGQERTLDPRAIVIADERAPTSIAGIMGGQRSEVEDDTTELLIEAATWTGPRIRRASVALKLRTEASSRFEKSLPLALADIGAARAAYLVAAEGARVRAPRAAGAAAACIRAGAPRRRRRAATARIRRVRPARSSARCVRSASTSRGTIAASR